MILSKEFLTGSVSGLPIQVTATTSGTANTIHTCHSTAKDEVWLWATNVATSGVDLTLCWGDVTVPGQEIMTISSKTKGTIAAEILSNSKIIKAFASNGAAILITGYVNRIA
jgi:hypothetical protein